LEFGFSPIVPALALRVGRSGCGGLSRSGLCCDSAVQRLSVDRLIAFHCAVATRHRIFFLWRPYLSDPKDDMILELAVKAKCDSVVTYNTKDFVGIERFGIQAVRPVDFLRTIGVLA
jgi:hypothetical protein